MEFETCMVCNKPIEYAIEAHYDHSKDCENFNRSIAILKKTIPEEDMEVCDCGKSHDACCLVCAEAYSNA